ncbi:MAG: hypothetical protein B6I28_01285 [Fusobacteriia bacterium 4572_132]|nr:MAG: hypothetical protein B6I28_01285 [Fusobacteriia bacterium 4572_132]
MLNKLRNSLIYKTALKYRTIKNDINVLYKSKNYTIVEDTFFETLLVGYEIISKLNKLNTNKKVS